MEHDEISFQNSAIHIEGCPDAVKIVALKDRRSRRLADLALHKADLEFAAECLEAINEMPPLPSVNPRGAVEGRRSSFHQCFGSSEARSQLSPGKIYKGQSLGILVFRFFQDLRDKHFVHDENSYAQCMPGVVLNDGRKDFKIKRIVCLRLRAQTLEREHWSNLRLLGSGGAAMG